MSAINIALAVRDGLVARVPCLLDLVEPCSLKFTCFAKSGYSLKGRTNQLILVSRYAKASENERRWGGVTEVYDSSDISTLSEGGAPVQTLSLAYHFPFPPSPTQADFRSAKMRKKYLEK